MPPRKGAAPASGVCGARCYAFAEVVTYVRPRLSTIYATNAAMRIHTFKPINEDEVQVLQVCPIYNKFR